ncbi:hypothetical protein, partial [Hydrogenophaga sp.]|uniref:hypothetical protein n=1 Tax=Hydrogenophaga sp. TaxID=1904254 RepID=UPI002727570A
MTDPAPGFRGHFTLTYGRLCDLGTQALHVRIVVASNFNGKVGAALKAKDEADEIHRRAKALGGRADEISVEP